MSTSAQITIKDKVSAKLDRLIRKMRRTQMSVSQVNQEVQVLGSKGRNVFQRIGDWARNARRRIDEARGSTERFAGAWSGVGSMLRGALAAFSIAAIKGKIDQAVGLFNQQYKFEMQLATVMKNSGADKEAFDSVRKEASRLQGKTTFGDEALIAGAAELGTYLSEPEAIKKMMSTLTDYAAGMGGMEADPKAMVDYATSLGKALEGNFEGLTKKGFAFSEAQKAIIKNGTEMERVAVINDVIAASWGGLSESFANTPEGQMIQTNNRLGDLGEIAGGKFVPAVIKAKKAFAELIERMAADGTLDRLIQGISGVIDGTIFLLGLLSGAINFTAQHWDVIQPILAAGITLMVAWKIATMAQAAAQLALNAAMSANPIYAIVIAIAALVAGFVYWSNSVGGLRIAWLIAVKDIGRGWDQIKIAFAQGKHAVQNLSDFIALGFKVMNAATQNVLGDMKVGVIMHLQNLVNEAIGVINGFISLINKIPGVNISLFDQVTFGTTAQMKNEAEKQARMAGLVNMKEQMEQAMRDRDEKINRMRSESDALYAKREAEIAQLQQDRVRNELLGNKTPEAWDASRAAMMPSHIDEVSEVGKISSDVHIAEEDLKLLKEYGTMTYAQNFVSYSPTIAMDATINEKADYRELIEKLNEAWEEEAVAFAEVMHH